MNRNYLFLAQGFEEIEALTVVDVLRRAGMDIKTVSVSSSEHVSGAHGIEVTADLLFDDSDYTDAEFLILPGGMPGSTNLYECEKLQQLLTSHASRGGKIAAICAAPAVVLAPLGLLKDKEATCYPGFDKDCRAAGAIMRDAPVNSPRQAYNRQRPQRCAAFCPGHRGQFDGRVAGSAGRLGHAVLPQEHELLFLMNSSKV